MFLQPEKRIRGFQFGLRIDQGEGRFDTPGLQLQVEDRFLQVSCFARGGKVLDGGFPGGRLLVAVTRERWAVAFEEGSVFGVERGGVEEVLGAEGSGTRGRVPAPKAVTV